MTDSSSIKKETRPALERIKQREAHDNCFSMRHSLPKCSLLLLNQCREQMDLTRGRKSRDGGAVRGDICASTAFVRAERTHAQHRSGGAGELAKSCEDLLSLAQFCSCLSHKTGLHNIHTEHLSTPMTTGLMK